MTVLKKRRERNVTLPQSASMGTSRCSTDLNAEARNASRLTSLASTVNVASSEPYIPLLRASMRNAWKRVATEPASESSYSLQPSPSLHSITVGIPPANPKSKVGPSTPWSPAASSQQDLPDAGGSNWRLRKWSRTDFVMGGIREMTSFVTCDKFCNLLEAIAAGADDIGDIACCGEEIEIVFFFQMVASGQKHLSETIRAGDS